MATSSLFKVLELNAEAAKELIKMQEEGFTVNKSPNVELKFMSDKDIEKLGKRLGLRKKGESNGGN